MACDVRIGTSGYHYKHWKGPFYPVQMPTDRMLDYYAQHFDTLELNNSFYRLPTEQAFVTWRRSTPPDFIFAVKASRFLTHNKKLKDAQSSWANFLPRVKHLGEKLGPILFQLPPKWQLNYERMKTFLELLPAAFRYVFEFRDDTWITPEIEKLLADFHAAFCIYELAGYHSPLTVTTDFAYVRLHGPSAGKYQGSYNEDRLCAWSRQIEDWGRTLKAVYIYFDNDQGGFAAQNALSLKRMVFGSKLSG